MKRGVSAIGLRNNDLSKSPSLKKKETESSRFSVFLLGFSLGRQG